MRTYQLYRIKSLRHLTVRKVPQRKGDSDPPEWVKSRTHLLKRAPQSLFPDEREFSEFGKFGVHVGKRSAAGYLGEVGKILTLYPLTFAFISLPSGRGVDTKWARILIPSIATARPDV